MAKQVLNIVDFSGGINKAVDKRDLEPNEVVHSDGLISYEPGKLTLDGTLNTIPGLEHNVGSFSNVTIGEGIPNFYGLFPELAFRVFGRAKCSVAPGDEATFLVDPAGAYHSLDVGAKLSIIKEVAGTGVVGDVITVSNIVSNTSFKATGCSNFSVDDIVYYVLNATYNADNLLLSEPNTGYDNNRFFLTASQYGKFGFYSIGVDKYWYGNTLEGTPNYLGNDPWFFDTKFLWDHLQNSQDEPGESLISDTRVLDAFYEDGAFRLLLDPPKAYRRGYCKRPVGLYSIDKNKNHFATGNNQYKINKGVYALRTHCLSASEYHSENNEFDRCGALAMHATYTSLSQFSSATAAVGDANKVNAVNIALGHQNNAVAGDFQFASGSEHRKIGIGISFLYDDIENPQESSISLVTDNGDPDGNNYVTMTSGEDFKALTLYCKVFIGENSFTPGQIDIIGNPSEVIAVPEFRGSSFNEGKSNYKKWNPRIVGANIYLTYNNFGPIDDPLYLATLNFNQDADLGLSKSHDGIEATSAWTAVSGQPSVHQMIENIPTVPVLPYSLKNGYKHNENIHAWYKTSAIVNRKLYAGNVAYYDKENSTISDDEKPSVFPDRILRSPVNKFDILPRSNFLDVTVHDSQDIVKLMAFNQKLLIFKHDDLLIVDCSGEIEILEATHRGMGLLSPTQVCASPNAIYWCNAQGVYGLDAENPPVNIIKNKIPTDEWSDKIYNNFTNVEYEPQDNLLFIFSKYEDYVQLTEHAKHIFIVNLNTGSVFFKSNPSTLPATQYSKGIIFNNQLYVGASLTNGTNELFTSIQVTALDPGKKAEGVVTFTINNSDSRNSLGGTANKYLKINQKTKGWTRVNGETLLESANVPTDSRGADRLIEEYNAKMNSANVFDGGADYDHSLIYDSTNNKFFAHVKAKLRGDAYTLLATSTVGSWGKSFYGLTNGTVGDPDSLGDIENFENVYNTPGEDPVMPVYRVFVNRANNTSAGVTYVLEYVSSSTGDTFLGVVKYTTSTDPASLYSATSVLDTTYTNDSDSTATNLQNSNALITNMRRFFSTNAMMEINGYPTLFKNIFDVSVLATDASGSITGTAGLKYFNLTLRDQGFGSYFVNANITTYVDSGSGGSLTKWNANLSSVLNNTHLETADYDFEQPNVRKKIYKAYITYKAVGGINVFYKANQSGDWIAATVTGATTTTNQLPTSATDYSRAEIKFGTGGNNVFSFALRFENDGYMQTFDVNDISFIYRPKRAK